MLAAKAAAAAALAWFVARHVPGVAADYPYYAPLGAVVAMQSTVFSGFRSGVQTLVGIVIGIAVAGVTIWLGDPGIWAVAVAVGVGVLIGGFRILGEGSSWAPTAAVFVLLVGGPNAEGYSVGYVVQVAIGVLIGLGVNFLVFPPLHFWDAERRIGEVNTIVADHLDGLAGAVDDSAGPTDAPGAKAWDVQQERLDNALADVRTRVAAAEESRRLNPRGLLRGTRDRLLTDAERFRALERAVWYTTDATELIARSGPISDRFGRPHPDFAEPLAHALRQVACVLRAECPPEAADQALSALEDALDAQDGALPSRSALTAATVVSLRGIVESERLATLAISDEPSADARVRGPVTR
jgi:uncharacterized membrane protein YgaE (UPF0421/DUF939 family)